MALPPSPHCADEPQVIHQPAIRNSIGEIVCPENARCSQSILHSPSIDGSRQMITAGRRQIEDFEIGWAVLVGRDLTHPRRAHFYDARNLDFFRAVCGKHVVAVTDALSFYPGNWVRCAHCQAVFDKRWH